MGSDRYGIACIPYLCLICSVPYTTIPVPTGIIAAGVNYQRQQQDFPSLLELRITSSVAYPDPVSGAFDPWILDPGWGKNQDTYPRSGINIPSQIIFPNNWVKNTLNSLIRIRIRDPSAAASSWCSPPSRGWGSRGSSLGCRGSSPSHLVKETISYILFFKSCTVLETVGKKIIWNANPVPDVLIYGPIAGGTFFETIFAILAAMSETATFLSTFTRYVQKHKCKRYRRLCTVSPRLHYCRTPPTSPLMAKDVGLSSLQRSLVWILVALLLTKLA